MDGDVVDLEDLAGRAAPGSAGDKPIYPAVPYYGPFIARELKPGQMMKWCTCGMRDRVAQ